METREEKFEKGYTFVKLPWGDNLISSSDGSLMPPSVYTRNSEFIVYERLMTTEKKNELNLQMMNQITFQFFPEIDRLSIKASFLNCKVNTFLDSFVLEDTKVRLTEKRVRHNKTMQTITGWP